MFLMKVYLEDWWDMPAKSPFTGGLGVPCRWVKDHEAVLNRMIHIVVDYYLDCSPFLQLSLIPEF